MIKTYGQRLQQLGSASTLPLLKNIQRGIEKESLRVTTNGHLSRSPHPQALGAALTHPHITTDYSEALLEFITPVLRNANDNLAFLETLHSFTYQELEHDEILWTSSMPCLIEGDNDIPLAQFGNSNIGKLKTLYREGLGHRYGRLMQTISGIHYNFSLPDEFWTHYHALTNSSNSSLSLQQFKTQEYLNLIRNFQRYSWLLLYLFGASPAVCRCFVQDKFIQGQKHSLQSFDDSTLYAPYGTSLRMGNLGYKSDAQESLFICYNDLDNYIHCLQTAMTTSYPAYEKIGLMNQEQHLQINTNLLQLENEFYSSIRPKRVGSPGQRPLQTLQQQGIEYIEIRCLDLNPFLALGIDTEQIHFLDTFLLFCLLQDHPDCAEEEFFEIGHNISKVVNEGRDPKLTLCNKGEQRSLREWADSLLQQAIPVAQLLDSATGKNECLSAIQSQLKKVEDDSLTPSAQILAEMQQQQLSYYQFSMQQSSQHSQYFRDKTIDQQQLNQLREVSEQSHHRQKEIEQGDRISFDEFLKIWNDDAFNI